MKNYIQVLLTEEDLKHISSLSKSRNNKKEMAGVKSKKFSTISDEAVHNIGISGEFAFAKHYGLSMNAENYYAGDDGYDFMTWHGLTIDVKTRTGTMKDLILASDSLACFTSDIMVCAWLDSNIVTFCGWTTRVHTVTSMSYLVTNATKIMVPHTSLITMDKLSGIIESR